MKCIPTFCCVCVCVIFVWCIFLYCFSCYHYLVIKMCIFVDFLDIIGSSDPQDPVAEGGCLDCCRQVLLVAVVLSQRATCRRATRSHSSFSAVLRSARPSVAKAKSIFVVSDFAACVVGDRSLSPEDPRTRQLHACRVSTDGIQLSSIYMYLPPTGHGCSRDLVVLSAR